MAVWLTSSRRASYGEGYSAKVAVWSWVRICLVDGLGVLDLEGEIVMLDRSRSWIESVEMCCAEGVS